MVGPQSIHLQLCEGYGAFGGEVLSRHPHSVSRIH